MIPIPIARPILGEEELAGVREVLASGMLAHGSKVEAFEKAFAKDLGRKHAIAVTNGTAALHVALLAHGIGPGQEVVIPPLTFFATASTVLLCGAKPVFVDIDRSSYNMDPAKVASAITRKTAAIMPVHLYGQTAEVDPIIAGARDRGIPVIEDAAQAAGAEYHGKKAGNLGDTACFSFYATKNMTTGEGGMIVTDDDRIAEKARLLRHHGQPAKYEHVLVGFNYRMTEIAAAMGLAQLAKLDGWVKQRRAGTPGPSPSIRASARPRSSGLSRPSRKSLGPIDGPDAKRQSARSDSRSAMDLQTFQAALHEGVQKERGLHWAEAADLYTDLAKASSDPAMRAIALLRRGNALMELRRWDDARAAFDAGLHDAKECGDPGVVAQALLAAGVVAANRDDPKRAEAFLLDALDRFHRKDDRAPLQGRGWAFLNLASLYGKTGRLDLAFVTFTKAQDVLGAAEDWGGVAAAWEAQAQLRRAIHDEDRWREDLAEAVVFYDREGMTAKASRLRGLLGKKVV